jgi:hypothetical protein
MQAKRVGGFSLFASSYQLPESHPAPTLLNEGRQLALGE